jgi:hypothetical protein
MVLSGSSGTERPSEPVRHWPADHGCRSSCVLPELETSGADPAS